MTIILFQTCAVDIFSLGCVYFYVLTNGRHPFGDSLRRQANILSGEYSLKELANNGKFFEIFIHLRKVTAMNFFLENHVYCALIEHMLNADPGKRPTVNAVLKHPFFWTPAQKLAFFQVENFYFE